MTHPLVDQLRFARSEWLRALQDVTDQQARRQLPSMKSISWIIGRMAWEEQLYWLERAQSIIVAPGLDHMVGLDRPPCSPPLAQMWAAWHAVTDASDPYLDSLTGEMLLQRYTVEGVVRPANIGTILLRVIYRYWYYIGESQAIRQLLGRQNLPQFMREFPAEVSYRPEAAVTAAQIAVAVS